LLSRSVLLVLKERDELGVMMKENLVLQIIRRHSTSRPLEAHSRVVRCLQSVGDVTVFEAMPCPLRRL